MFFRKIKREHELVRTFQKLFLGQGGRLKPEAAVVLEFLRDEAGARGELGNGSTPYFYDAENRFDPNAAAFVLGKRRIFDLIVKYLALSETEVFALYTKLQRDGEDVKRELEV